jgi:VCBS repeat-containing protein
VINALFSKCCNSKILAMTTIDFTKLPSSSAPTFQQNGITITTSPGSNLVINANRDELGLGVNDSTIEAGESVFFAFNQGAASGISYTLDSATTSDGDDLFAEGELEAFDVNGKSLGVVPFGVAASNTVIADISAAFKGQLISRFRLTQTEGARIGSLSFTPVPVVVANADAITTNENNPVSFNVRTNDTFLLSGSPTISVNTAGLKGRLTNNGNGKFTYNPGDAFQSLTAGETATTRFKYTLKAGNHSSTATVTLRVTGLNDASNPKSNNDPLTGSDTDNSGVGSPNDGLLTGGLKSDLASASPAASLSAEAEAVTIAPVEPTQSATLTYGETHYNESNSPLGVSSSDLTLASIGNSPLAAL